MDFEQSMKSEQDVEVELQQDTDTVIEDVYDSDVHNDTTKTKPIMKYVLLHNPFIICPLDESHRIRIYELQSHLERCLTGDLVEKTCSKNSQHIVDESSYEHHIKNCSDLPTKN